MVKSEPTRHSGGRMTKESAEKFIELVRSYGNVLGTITVVRLVWPFPWLKPWQWPAWSVWRIKRKGSPRFKVPTLIFDRADADKRKE